jgi:hypothetical protein
MSVTDEQIAQAQEFLTAWSSVTSLPMPAHVVDFARAIQEEAYKAGMAAERERWNGVAEYLQAASDGSMSRNNSEQLAYELLQQLQEVK